ncbi:EF-hand_domain pair [Hexamita inflata]|nr:EF-hand domain pair [Hexamita inflata]
MHIYFNADLEDYNSIIFYAADQDFSGTLNKNELKSLLKQEVNFNFVKRYLAATAIMIKYGNKGELSHENFLELAELFQGGALEDEIQKL